MHQHMSITLSRLSLSLYIYIIIYIYIYIYIYISVYQLGTLYLVHVDSCTSPVVRPPYGRVRQCAASVRHRLASPGGASTPHRHPLARGTIGPPLKVVELVSAPRATKCAVTAGWPCRAAKWRGCRPSLLVAANSTPWRANKC